MPRLTRTRPMLAMAAVMMLSACLGGAPEATGTRDASVPMSSLAAFDAKAFAGRWYEVETYLPAGASCVIGAVTFSPQKSGDMTVTEGPCADGAPQRGFARRIGPGRFDFQGRELWVLWVDQEYEVAVLATPEGRAHILSRRLEIRDDKRAAAREILAWNGFDIARLSPARRR
ncbi:lipocalin family protein [Celeribacter sp.]|uniref:lipocalin family protein n=1 Tax=Celeribacter sp. TaxID=1890673 RepID=UPI003A9136FB